MRGRAPLAAIVVAGAAVRLAWVLYAARQPQTLADPAFYSLFAEQIADGNGYVLVDGSPTAYYPPGYPIFLGVVLWAVRGIGLSSDIPTIAGVANLVLGTTSIVLVFLIGRRLFDERVGLVAAALFAFWPNLVFHTAVALTETLFNFLMLAAVLVLVGARWEEKRFGVGRLVAAGVLLGLAAYVRPISVLLLPVLAFLWWRARFGWRRNLGQLAVLTVTIVAVLVPWTVRNADAMGSFVAVSTNTGDNLCIGRHEGATGGFSLTPECFDGYDDLERPEYELERDEGGTRKALRYVRDHPVEEVTLVFKRAWHTISNDHDGLRAVESYEQDRFLPDGVRRGLSLLADVWFYVVGLLGIAGIAVAWPHGDARRRLVVLAIAAMALPPLVFFGDPRFKVPLVPFLAVTAAALLVRLPEVLRPSPRGTPPRR